MKAASSWDIIRRPRLTEKATRLREEAAGWEVQAHKALLAARKLEAKAARLSAFGLLWSR